MPGESKGDEQSSSGWSPDVLTSSWRSASSWSGAPLWKTGSDAAARSVTYLKLLFVLDSDNFNTVSLLM